MSAQCEVTGKRAAGAETTPPGPAAAARAKRYKSAVEASAWAEYGNVAVHRNARGQLLCQCSAPETPRQAKIGPRGGNAGDARWCHECVPGDAFAAGRLVVVVNGCVCGRANRAYGVVGGKRSDARWCHRCRQDAGVPTENLVSAARRQHSG